MDTNHLQGTSGLDESSAKAKQRKGNKKDRNENTGKALPTEKPVGETKVLAPIMRLIRWHPAEHVKEEDNIGSNNDGYQDDSDAWQCMGPLTSSTDKSVIQSKRKRRKKILKKETGKSDGLHDEISASGSSEMYTRGMNLSYEDDLHPLNEAGPSSSVRNNRVEAFKAKLKKMRGKFSKKDEELNRVRKETDFQKGDLEEMRKRYEEELQMYSRKVEQLEKEKNDLQIRGTFSNNDEEINRVRKVKDFPHEDLDEMSKRYEEELQMYSRKVEQLEKEKKDLQIRLSSYAAARMTNENPYITDLNDPNRPTKISERYSELYDNHWTDAFVKLQDKHHLSETEAIDFLLDVLYVSFVECKQVRLQRERAFEALNQYIGADGDDQDLTVLEVMKRLKYAKKTNIKRMHRVFKESVETKLLKKMKYMQTLHDIRPYLDECVEVCLLMNIQEPPLELRGMLFSRRSLQFDISAFRSYTKSGKKMDYVVWPVLHLFYDGPLLCKGIAQGMPEPSDAQTTKKVKVKDRQSEHN